MTPSPGAVGSLLFYNGDIYTVDQNQAWAEALVVENGRITFVGDLDEARRTIDGEVVERDLAGAFMMPGIHDVHMHPLEASSENFHFVLEDEVEDPEDYAFEIVSGLRNAPRDGWILGWGHDLEILLMATRPPREILDEVESDQPLAIMEATSHSIWCNSQALEFAEFTSESDNPIGGVIMKDQAGVPNGVLIDNAGNQLIDLALPPSDERRTNDYNGLLDFGLPELARHGITSICDARTYWKRDHHLIWQELERNDELTARVNLGLWAYPTEDDTRQIGQLRAMYDFDQSKLLRINQIKVYVDGIIHNTTSLMHDEYMLNYFGLTDNRGLNYFSQDRLSKYIAQLEPLGFDFHMHAIGNRGINQALNAVEESGSAEGRHRVTHVEYVHPDDYLRFSNLNVTADAQVAGDFTNPRHWHDFDYLITRDISQSFVPIRTLAHNGARITLSSDWDVSTINPFVGMQNAVTRAPQNLTIEEVIKAYTINAAYVMRQEDMTGTLEVGKWADLIVLDQNLLEVGPGQISATEVMATYLGGQRIYGR